MRKLALEAGLVDFDRVSREKRLVASTAARLARRPRLRHAVYLSASPADDLARLSLMSFP